MAEDQGPDPSGTVAATTSPASTSFRADDGDDRRLDRRVVTVWTLSTAVSLLVPTAAASVPTILLLDTVGWVILAVGLALTVGMALWYPRAAYARWRWRLTELAVELDHGVIVRRHEALPYFRIQQIDVTRGPLDRMLGLASLEVTSASASGSVSLPGLAADDAPEVRRELLERASAAVAQHEGEARDAV